MTDETDEFELADANHVRVLETNLLHSSDVIYWLDGASAEQASAMARIDIPLAIRFTQKPRSLKFLHSLGKTAFWQTPVEDMHEGVANEAQRARPVQPPLVVRGEVSDPRGRYNPAAFEASLGAGNGQPVVLYPSPLGVRPGAGGVLFGRVSMASSLAPLLWGLLELEVALGLSQTQTYRAQTDAKGDFRIALDRLPPLPQGTTHYNASLRILGNPAATVDTPVAVGELPALALESFTQQDSFSQDQSLTVRPALHQRLQSANKTFIAVQTV
ncbi:hypothetical protein [Cellvibrio japonicus]|uniref:Uncharacterized protein n=1 Tax=Cellvibrio japonicus (strain Ueda107) TaxID=498211 RepID=B3PD97_CELJU|nr:hypothetical protein [Cellvibrio japonicus]ACE85420.1 hypothetical protein CJA_3055 [Cellvibrio japonicus Ueda107]QEI13356.1 carboxypeptidase regulatory-like domain-containing protein [Cellvibrio japonicus]QEI16930.1 carboxypeptidase regulatory-like domain-containing protein [Cellvibrio japonicus]QEI20508.1 carboxypeptidase regulatory-like domain-containing protein [Cellvibrio japonicus]